MRDPEGKPDQLDKFGMVRRDAMKQFTTFKTLALSALLVAAPAFAVNSTANPIANSAVDGAPTLTAAEQNWQLTENVRKALNSLAYYSVFDDLSYSVDGDQVVLAGQVSRPVIRNSAVRAVERIPGVTTVVDRIEVLPLSSYDDRLRVNAYYAIYGTPALSRYAINGRPPIRIIVRNGDVTLEGVVNNDLDRKIAYNRIAGLPGAFTVTNHLRLDRID